MKKISFVFLFGLLFINACRKTDNTKTSDIAVSEDIWAVEVAPLEGDSYSKSQTEESTYAQINDINIFVYQNGVLVNGSTDASGAVTPYKTFLPGKNSTFNVNEVFPNMNETYNVYIMANIGEVDYAPYRNEGNLVNLQYTYDTYEAFEAKGFPKAKEYKNFTPSQFTSKVLLVEQLMTRYTITLTNVSGMNFTLKSMMVGQAPKDIHPFVEHSKASAVFNGDTFTDVEVYNNTGTVFVMENYRGDVFKSAVTSIDRNKGNFKVDEEASLTTFIEFKGNRQPDSNGFSREITYRYYFGEGTSAFVPRNSDRTLSIDLTECCDVVSGELYVIRNDNYMVVMNPDPNDASNSLSCSVTIKHKAGLDYTISGLGDLNYRKKVESATSDVIEFYGTSDKYTEAKYALGCSAGDYIVEDDLFNEAFEEREISFTYKDTTITQKVYYLKSSLGCYYSLDADNLTVAVFNRLGLSFDCALQYTTIYSANGSTPAEEAVNNYTFSIKPTFRSENHFFDSSEAGEKDKTVCKGYFAKCPYIGGLYSGFSGPITGVIADLKIACKELPKLRIKYGKGQLIYHKNTGAFYMESIRFCYPNGQRYYFTAQPGIKRSLPQYLKSNKMQYFVNGDPDIKIIE